MFRTPKRNGIRAFGSVFKICQTMIELQANAGSIRPFEIHLKKPSHFFRGKRTKSKKIPCLAKSAKHGVSVLGADNVT